MPQLRELDLTGNGLGDDGITRLAEALRVNRTLTALRFDRNGVGGAGLKALKMAL